MTTLNDIISSIDHRLMLAEQANASTSRTSFMFGAQEKMRKFVLVHVDDEKIAIPIDGLAEIGPMPAITPLPNLPRWIHGIVNLRGEIVSIIDMNGLLTGGQNAEQMRGQKLSVLRNGPMKVGICIDRVIATVSKPDSDQSPSPDSQLTRIAPSVFGKSLMIDTTVYQIMQTDVFLNMDRLMQYYIAE